MVCPADGGIDGPGPGSKFHLELSFQFGDAPAGSDELRLIGTADARALPGVDQVLATPGVDDLLADVQVAGSLADAPAGTSGGGAPLGGARRGVPPLLWRPPQGEEE